METEQQVIKALNTICNGWTSASPGGLLCNPNAGGGIIDAEIDSGKWFVIFNDGRAALEGYASREDAVEGFVLAIRSNPDALLNGRTQAHWDRLFKYAFEPIKRP